MIPTLLLPFHVFCWWHKTPKGNSLLQINSNFQPSPCFCTRVLARQPTSLWSAPVTTHQTQLNKQHDSDSVWISVTIHRHTHLKSRTARLCLVFSGALTQLWDSSNSMEFATLIPIRISRWGLLTGLSVWNKFVFSVFQGRAIYTEAVMCSENAALLTQCVVNLCFEFSPQLICCAGVTTLIIPRVDQSPNLIDHNVALTLTEQIKHRGHTIR